MAVQLQNHTVSPFSNRRGNLQTEDEPRASAQAPARSQATADNASLLQSLDSHAKYRQNVINAFAANDASAINRGSPEQVLFEQQFAELAANPDEFHAFLSNVYGKNYDRNMAESLRLRALAGDFTWLPTLQFVGESVLGNANGAYDSSTNTIYINENLRGTKLASEVFIEEAGHAIDTLLNNSDTAGDEGELFRRLLGGEALTADDFKSIRSEDDVGQITINGQTRTVEFWSLGGWIQDKIIDPVVDNVIDPIVENVVEPVVEFVDDHIVQPVVGVVEDAYDISVNALETGFDIGSALLHGGIDVAGNLLQGDFSGAWDAAKNTGQEVWDETLGFIVESGAMGLHALSSYLNGTFGLAETRGLNADERAYLYTIYGDSLDYDAIRIQQGGIEAWVGMDPHTVGNDIYLPDNNFGADGQLTQDGLELLSHEVAHSWQFQNAGAGYLSEALLSYVGDGDPYDWMTAFNEQMAFDDMTPDQQAEFARLIGIAIAQSPSGTLDFIQVEALIRSEFNDPLRSLTAAEFAYIQGIHARLTAGDA